MSNLKQAIKQKGGMKDKEIYGYSPEAIDKICKKINLFPDKTAKCTDI